MKLLPLAISARQASRLRNGHKVRVKHGRGFNVVVNPDTYQVLTRTFMKNKGAELKLSDEELEANMTMTPEDHQRKMSEEEDEFHINKLMEGGSLFGKVKKGINKFMKSKTAKQIGSVLKPIGKQLAKEGVKQLAKGANESVDPKYKPAVSVLTGALSKKANKSIDGLGIHKHRRLHELNKETGTNHGYLGRAGIDNAIANSKNAELIKSSINSRHNINNAHSEWDDPLAPRSRGTGVSHSSRRPMGILEGRGTLHHGPHGLPPALQSQPNGINYQFRHTLPPQFQNRMGGEGLYA